MSEAFIVRRGGVGTGGLNFRIKEYSSFSQLPEKAPENEIAIITEAPVTKWLFDGISAKPRMSEGNLLLNTDGIPKASFNAVKSKRGDELPVGFSNPVQKVGTKYVRKECYIFQGGRWRQVSKALGDYLYDGSVPDDLSNNELTGGWKGFVRSLTTQSFVFTGGVGEYKTYTAKAIDLTYFSKLRIYFSKMDYSGGSGGQIARVYFGKTNEDLSNATLISYSQSPKWVEIDIAKLVGSYYIGFTLNANYGDNNLVMTVTNHDDLPGIYLE